MSSPLFVPEGAQPTDSPMACWSDGFEHTVIDITKRQRLQTNKRDMPTVVWEGIHCASKHRVFVKRRQDRELLMSLFEQGPQICQIRVDTFGDDVTVAEPLAAKFMTKVASCTTKVAWTSAISNNRGTSGCRLARRTHRLFNQFSFVNHLSCARRTGMIS